jgi:hypothetical protein
MKNIRLGVLLHLTLLFELRLFGRNKPQQILLILQFQSMIITMFCPHFYSKNGTSTRSASGQPVPNIGKTELIIN